jgi:SAM-dependent methyltransferase
MVYASVLSTRYDVQVFESDVDVVAHMQASNHERAVVVNYALPTSLPLENNYADLVILHMHDIFDPKLAQLVLNEQFRCMRSGGVLVVFNIDPDQLEHGFWYSKYLPKALEIAKSHHLTNEVVTELIAQAGFKNTYIHYPKKTLILPDYYRDPLSFFYSWFRCADPICRWAEVDEIESACDELGKLAEMGELLPITREPAESPQVSMFIGYVPFYDLK